MSPPRDYRQRSVRFARRRLQLDLGWPGMAVALIVAASLLWAVFQAGASYERSRQASPTTPIESAGDGQAPADETGESPNVAAGPPLLDRDTSRTPPTPPLSTGAGDEPPPEAAPAAVQREFAFRKGYDYVIVQHFPKKQGAAANLAWRYLKTNGVDCVILDDRDIQLIATTPFLINQSDSAAKATETQRCEELKQRIRTLGKEYAREHGYAFEQCYARVVVR
ncbi:MAG: hypothetical protein PVJ57_11835 [Phycisphaerae bacterium]|jgi:hypothetical protein